MRIFILCFSLCLLHLSMQAQKDYTSLVNPFIGTGGHGHTFPGASLPFGMMQLSPDTRMADWDGSSGYHYSDSVIYGFSHTHLSGTGIPDYCDVLFMPFTGKVNWDPDYYRSGFSHAKEKAGPGYYEVFLDKYQVKAQLTTTIRCGMHQYSFPLAETKGNILIDLNHRDQVLEARIEKLNDHEIRGFRRSRSWAQDQVLYFHVKFERPIKDFTLALNDSIIQGKTLEGKNIKAALGFDLEKGKMVRCRIGISGVSMDGARKNLETEIRDWDFNKIKTNAKAAWNRELGKIDIKGGSRDRQTVFYTALYHTFLVPNIFQDMDGQFRSTDGKTHQAKGFTNYSVFSLWDTYRAYHPLMTIINRQRTKDWIQTFLAQFQYGGMLPVWELAANETFCMIGYHSVPVITDAFQKGITGFDEKLALNAMRSYAESERFGLRDYREKGYLSNDKEHESVSKTLEYAYDDWCIAQFAKMTGNDPVYRTYIRRAQQYKNIFDPSTRHMRGKLESRWHQPFDPREINNFFTEGNSWQYSFAVPQDIEGLIRLHGGPEGFSEKLNELFTTSTQTTGRDQADVTGLIGQYAQGNEPSHHMAYLFNYIRQPWRTQELVEKICQEFYRNDPDGLIGNEDCGQMSAWYILSAMGFYPVCPGNGEYVIGIPQFDEIRIHLENGKQFLIRSSNRKNGLNYVSQIAMNGRPYKKTFITHADIARGGSIEFALTSAPDKKAWAQFQPPTSAIKEEAIVSVPFIETQSNKFRDQLYIDLKHMDPTAEIFYSDADTAGNKGGWKKYSGSLNITESGIIYAYALKNKQRSKTISQNFHRIPGGLSVSVLSKVHPLYTAGGPEALIDGIMGTTNWRTGEWQSYFDQDFEAIIDLETTRPVKYAGIHVLQDVSPWIIFPGELVIYSGMDSSNFREIGRITNEIKPGPDSKQTMILGMELDGKPARFLKIKATNGGKLPAWHESAGNPSHLFIDEIIIK